MSTIGPPFTGSFITSSFSSVLIIFCRFFAWIALGGVDLRFSLLLVTKPNLAEEGTTTAAKLYHRRNQSIHMIDGVTVTSISTSPLHKISAVTDRLCQIALNWNLSLEFENTCKFSNRINAKSLKTIAACNKLSSTFELVYRELSSSLLLYSPLKVTAINEMFSSISKFDIKLFISYFVGRVA